MPTVTKREQQQRYYQKHKAKTIQRNWVRQIGKLGCSEKLYTELFEKQNGVCAICSGTNKMKRRLAVDHDHATGAIRGLLCSSCNTALGLLKDSAYIVEKAKEYLCRTIR